MISGNRAATEHGLGGHACAQVTLPNEEQREAILRVTLHRHALENEIDEELLRNEPNGAGERPLRVCVSIIIRLCCSGLGRAVPCGARVDYGRGPRQFAV